MAPGLTRWEFSLPRLSDSVPADGAGHAKGGGGMSRFDRYLLSQFLQVFGFFSLVMVGIYWVNRAVILFDQLMGDGQSLRVFLEFSALTLPGVVKMVLPISAFAATLYAGNRLMQDSEFVVMQATGFSSARLARPAAIFGLLAAAMMMLLTNFLVPMSRVELQGRSDELAENVTARFLKDGEFMQPAKGLTLYIREITPQGELRDLLLNDARDPDRPTLYLARSAVFGRGDDGPRLVMVNGQAQVLDRATRRLEVTRFDDFTYDIGAMMGARSRRTVNSDALSTLQLIAPTDEMVKGSRLSRERLQVEGHNRLSQPLLAAAAALAGFCCLLVGSFSRFGPWKQILGAIGLGIAVQLVDTWATAWAGKVPGGWPAVYAAPVLGVLCSAALIWWSQRPRRVAAGVPA